MLEQKTPQPEEEYLKAAPFLRPSFVRFMESKNILIEGIHIVGSPFWTVHLLYSDNAMVRDVSIETYSRFLHRWNRGRFQQDVRIANCYLDNGDDAIVLKSGKDADGLRVNRSTENVTITNCTVHHASAGVVIGSEMSGSVRNVVASNIVCQGTWMGMNIKSDRGRGGVVENVRMNNWTMDDVGRAINVSQYYVLEGRVNSSDTRVTQRTPVFRNIAIDNMTIIRCRATVGYEQAPPVMINIEGLPEMPISGLRISNVIASGQSGLKVHDTAALELRNVQVNAANGPAFLIRDSKDLELDGVSTRETQGGRAGDPAGPLPRSHRAGEQGVRRHGDVSFSGAGRDEEPGAGRERIGQCREGHRRVGHGLLARGRNEAELREGPRTRGLRIRLPYRPTISRIPVSDPVQAWKPSWLRLPAASFQCRRVIFRSPFS